MYKLVKESQYFVAWICYYVCLMIGTIVLGAVAGAILGIVLSMQGLDLGTVKAICGVVGFILAIPVSYVFFRFFVGKMIVEKIEADLHDVIEAALEQPAEDVEGSHTS